MTTKTDLQFTQDDLYTMVMPVSEQGQEAWEEICKQTQGTGKILNQHWAGVKLQLKQAGYKVRKAPKVKTSDADLLAELGL